jgi:thiamine pyrophosphokinase
MNSTTIWDPLDIFQTKKLTYNSDTTVLAILNQPITKENQHHFISLWANSQWRFCADGGTNRLYEWASISGKVEHYLPNFMW